MQPTGASGSLGFCRLAITRRPLRETVATGVAGTALGGFLALPMAALAARHSGSTRRCASVWAPSGPYRD